jgi:hypothetical protein
MPMAIVQPAAIIRNTRRKVKIIPKDAFTLWREGIGL